MWINFCWCNFTVVSYSAKNIDTRVFPKKLNPRYFFIYGFRIYSYIFWLNCKKRMNLWNILKLFPQFLLNYVTQCLFPTSEVDKVKRPKFSHHWFFERFSSNRCFLIYSFSQLTVLGTVTIPQIKLYSSFLRKLSRFNYQLIWNTLDRNCFKKFQIISLKWKKYPFYIKTENSHSKYYNSFQNKTETISQLDFLTKLIKPPITSNRHFEHKIDEIPPISSTPTEKIIAKKQIKTPVLVSKLQHKQLLLL